MLSPILSVADIDASIQFYTDAFQFQEGWRAEDDNGVVVFAMVKMGVAEILLGTLDGFVDVANRDKLGIGIQIYIELPGSINIDDLHNQAKSKGANIISPVVKRDWGERVFTVKDPDGYFFMFAETVKSNN